MRTDCDSMSKLTDNSKMTRVLRFTTVAVIVGYLVVRFVVFTQRELDGFGVWVAIWIFGMMVGLFHTWFQWEQCRKAPVSQLLLVTFMTFGPSVIVIAIENFIGWWFFWRHVTHLAK
jgi:hypothetical protein